MDITTVCVAGGVVFIAAIFFAIKSARTTNAILKNNTNVVPLLMQKSTQAKVVRLQQATQDDTAANERLHKLTAAYKNSQINVQQYNDKLDAMLARFDNEL